MVNKYYLCTNILRALPTACLNAFHRNQDARECSENSFEHSQGVDNVLTFTITLSPGSTCCFFQNPNSNNYYRQNKCPRNDKNIPLQEIIHTSSQPMTTIRIGHTSPCEHIIVMGFTPKLRPLNQCLSIKMISICHLYYTLCQTIL